MSKSSRLPTRSRLPILAVMVLTASAACGRGPAELGDPVRRDKDAQSSSAITRAEALWADRVDEPKVIDAIAEWKKAVLTADSDAKSWLMLARAQYFWADGFLDVVKAPNDIVTK